MRGHSQKRTAKFLVEGASDIRGALKEEETEDKPVQVKKERLDDHPTTERLREAIIAKRRNMGLEVDTKRLFQESSVKHELTPEELEKKERRKEQNRRAARKCRQKKKLLQAEVGNDFSKMLKDNKLMEKEILTLRAEKATLEKTLADHLVSGSCKNIKVESPGCAVVPNSPAAAHTTMPSSPSPSPSMSLYSSTTSPHTVLDPVSPPAVTTTSTTTHFESEAFNSEAYLQDLGPISPDQTFTDLEMWPDISEMNLNLDELGSLSNETITADIPSRLAPYSQSMLSEPSTLTMTIPSPLSDSSSWTVAADPMESLKTLMPSKPCDHVTRQLGGSVSPSQNASFKNHHLCHQPENQDRFSVSSVASDWSISSEQSQGFAIVPSGMESPLRSVTGRSDGCTAANNHNYASITTFGSSSSEPADDRQEGIATECSPAGQMFWSHGLAAPDSGFYYGDGGLGGLGDDEEDDDVFQNVYPTGADENIFQQYARRQ